MLGVTTAALRRNPDHRATEQFDAAEKRMEQLEQQVMIRVRVRVTVRDRVRFRTRVMIRVGIRVRFRFRVRAVRGCR